MKQTQIRVSSLAVEEYGNFYKVWHKQKYLGEIFFYPSLPCCFPYLDNGSGARRYVGAPGTEEAGYKTWNEAAAKLIQAHIDSQSTAAQPVVAPDRLQSARSSLPSSGG